MAEEDDMDLSNFMEVLTTYKCRFCSFICSQPEFMIKHVKASHIQSQLDKSASVIEGDQHGGDNTASCNSPIEGKTETLDDRSERERCSDGNIETSRDENNVLCEITQDIDEDIHASGDEIKSEDRVCGDELQNSTSTRKNIVTSNVPDSQNNMVRCLENQTVGASMNPTVIFCMGLPQVQDGCTDSVVVSGVEKTLESGCPLLESDVPGHPYATRSNEDFTTCVSATDAHTRGTVLTHVVLPVSGLSFSSKKNVESIVEDKSGFAAVVVPSMSPENKTIMIATEQNQTSTNLTTISNVGPSLHGTSSKAFICCMEPSLDAGNPETSIVHVSNIEPEEEPITETFTGRSDYGEDNIVVRELFLCGICSQTFCSIESVGDHMKMTHPEAVPFLSKSTDVDKSSTVNQGHETASKKKKPGRKKKSEMIEQEEDSKKDSEDEDWEPGRDLGVRRDGRKRRKTQPPHALKKDYYIEKDSKSTGKKRRNRYSIVDTHSLKCHVFGCQARFVFDQTLDYHLRCHDDCGCFSCPECQQEFKLWNVLKLHLWKEHSVDLDLFKCDQCEYRVDTVRKLTIHKEIHSENRPYTCDICGKGFKQFSQMKNHQVIHEVRDPNNPSSWYASKQCDICKRWYSNKKSLQKHVEAVHNKERPYLCPFCNHKAARKAMIQLHIRTHTGEKPFMCNVCQYSTGDHNSMRKHRMRHTGQRQYKCKYCSYSCIQAISLKSHLKTKHPGKEGIYSCGSCHFKTVNKIHFEHHVADHQNGLVEALTVDKPKRQRLQRIPIIQVETIPRPEPVQVEMQVQTMESGEAQISADDLAKLTNCTGLLSGKITAVQLIYSALSAISHNAQSDGIQTAQLPGGIETTIRSESGDPGVTTHTITFNVPSKIVSSEAQAEQVIFAESLEVVEAGNIEDHTRLQIDLDAVPVISAEAGSNVECADLAN